MPLTPTESNDTVRSEQDVRNYYDDNTNLFQKLGEGSVTGAIHQPLFVNGNESAAQAAHAQHRMIHELMTRDSEKPPSSILDLGCGTGSAIAYLSDKFSGLSHITGVTISSKQAELGNERLESMGFSNARIICGSYLDLPEEVPVAETAYAIESFIHTTDAKSFFHQVFNKLEPGGMLIIFDDFLQKGETAKAKDIEAFVDGWRANALFRIAEVSTMAYREGFSLIDAQNLTPFLRLWRPRDKFVYAIQPVLPILPLSGQYKRFLRGGNARQQLYRDDRLVYAMLVFLRHS